MRLSEEHPPGSFKGSLFQNIELSMTGGYMFEITDIRVKKLITDSKVRGLAAITISDVFVVHDIKIIEGEKGMFIAMPSRKAKDGSFKDIAHPINSDTRKEMQERILKAYEEAPEAEPSEETLNF